MDFQPIITTIQNSEVEDATKQMILGKLSDSALSDDQKMSAVNEFIATSQTEIAKADKDALDAIYKDADAEMADAEKEYTDTLKELSDEAVKVDQEVNAALDSANA